MIARTAMTAHSQTQHTKALLWPWGFNSDLQLPQLSQTHSLPNFYFGYHILGHQITQSFWIDYGIWIIHCNINHLSLFHTSKLKNLPITSSSLSCTTAKMSLPESHQSAQCTDAAWRGKHSVIAQAFISSDVLTAAWAQKHSATQLSHPGPHQDVY